MKSMRSLTPTINAPIAAMAFCDVERVTFIILSRRNRRRLDMMSAGNGNGLNTYLTLN